MTREWQFCNLRQIGSFHDPITTRAVIFYNVCARIDFMPVLQDVIYWPFTQFVQIRPKSFHFSLAVKAQAVQPCLEGVRNYFVPA